MSEFEGIVPALGQALSKRGFSALTPVQTAVLDPALGEADMLVSAQTGSGKTVAFGAAIAPTLLAGADRFARAKTPSALVVAPTRELALQVSRELAWLYETTGAVIATCVGGMDMSTERRTLNRGAHIVVGTPGRLCDHIRRQSLDPSKLKAVILDEADEMLDLGFREELEFILEETPSERRTLMFSATVPQSITKMAKRYQREAVRVTAQGEQKQHVDIEYRALTVAPKQRENAIINVLRYYEAENALVFCNTRATVNHMVARFNNRNFSVVALSGELSQKERTHALQAMRDGRARVCIATDVAARGIDLPNLDLVIHADLPTNPDTLLHRSGRTGRAGRKGVSVLIVSQKGRRRVEQLLRFAKINAAWAAPPSAAEIVQRDQTRILDDPMLSDPLNDDEQAFAGQILAKYPPEQVAAAFVRLHKAGQSAPEELQDVPVHVPERSTGRIRPERGGGIKRRDEFAESVWCTVSVGRKQNAEPRWLIPLLCKSGGISKSEIGLIKLQDQETFIQLNAESAEGFFDHVGPNRVLEKNITVTRLDGAPEFGGPPPNKPVGRKRAGEKKKQRQSGEAGHVKNDSPRRFKNTPADGKKDKRRGAYLERKFGPQSGEVSSAKSDRPKETEVSNTHEAPGAGSEGSSNEKGWAKKKSKRGSKRKKAGSAGSAKLNPGRAKPKRAKRKSDPV